MKQILFINCSVYLPGESALKRTMYLFEMMHQNGDNVHFLTADFNHYSKEQRNIADFYAHYPQYRDAISFISVPGYKKNISPKRFWSNLLFERRVMRWLKDKKDTFSTIYLSLPTIYLGGRLGRFCRKNGIRLVIDVNDLWPEAYRLMFRKEWLYRLCTYPLKALAEKGYAAADCVIAVSDEYRDRALRCNTKDPVSRTVYLGAMLDRFDRGVETYAETISKPEGEFWIGYAGTIGASYDIKTVIDTIAQLHKDGCENIRFMVMGQGPELAPLKAYVRDNGIPGVEFLGFLDYEKMAAYLSKCDLAVNCIKKRASQSIINKVSDYWAAGLPVLNSCVSKEMMGLVEQYGAGTNYEAEDPDSLAQAILTYYKDPQAIAQIRRDCRKLAQEKFDREKTHRELAELLKTL